MGRRDDRTRHAAMDGADRRRGRDRRIRWIDSHAGARGSMIRVREIESDDDVRRSFAVMRQLRPHLAEDEYVARVRSMRPGGYRLAIVDEDGDVRAAAGFRLIEMLHQGLHLYVDDLV